MWNPVHWLDPPIIRNVICNSNSLDFLTSETNTHFIIVWLNSSIRLTIKGLLEFRV